MCVKAIDCCATKTESNEAALFFDLSNSDHRHYGWNKMMTTRILQLMRGPRQVLLFK